jgi:diacylglycerol O-acyltransferase
VPVSIRQKGDIDSSNAIAAISADLATNIADPVKRFAAIQASVHAGRALYQGMAPSEVQLFALAMQAPSMLLMPLGLASKLPPYNTVISNVPGIQEPMYWNGARMNGSYPLSIVTDGIALNITLLTYDKQVDFGIIACRRSVPQVQRLIDYMEDALVELEEAAGISGGKKPAGKPGRKAPKTANTTKAASAKKTKARTQTKSAKKPAGKTKVTPKPKAKSQTKTKTKPQKRVKSKAASRPKSQPRNTRRD